MIESWMGIGGITFAIAAFSFFLPPRDVKWFVRLTRPGRLIFEPLIPFIWTTIFICGAASANMIWQANLARYVAWIFMAGYLLLEIITVSYIPVMLRWHHLRVGQFIGSFGILVSLLLALSVLPVSKSAALLLVPYLIWSPIGTYTTEELAELNPQDA
jgi:tryptophan-rich sensory protein